MTFFNEMITEDDRNKYGLNELDRHIRGWAPQRQWTIDREKDVYLRQIGRTRIDDGGDKPVFTWHLYWKGELMRVCTEVIDAGSGGPPVNIGWTHYRLVDCFNQGFFVPRTIMENRSEIIADLREALIAHRGGGVFAGRSNYEVIVVI